MLGNDGMCCWAGLTSSSIWIQGHHIHALQAHLWTDIPEDIAVSITTIALPNLSRLPENRPHPEQLRYQKAQAGAGVESFVVCFPVMVIFKCLAAPAVSIGARE